ncbi:MAG: hypothetical protein KF773_31090 [Deltaproteobacteria bacterium]|nr:hypothetical protein [Deltaproteobacteria bacterium]
MLDQTRGLKVHLRTFDIHGRTLRVVTLRPQYQVRFSTNYFHDTWHIISGPLGAHTMGRLMWGLAFQRHAGTMVLVDEPHLVSTPFDGDAADPILIVPDGLTSVSDDDLRALRLRLRRCPPSPTTIRWHTFGLPVALASRDPRSYAQVRRDHRAALCREQMSRRAGFVVYTAPPVLLRENGADISRMGGDNYHMLAESRAPGRWHHDGEFQVIDDFDDRVSAARVVRRELLGGDHPHRRIAETAEAWEIADGAAGRVGYAKRERRAAATRSRSRSPS